MSDIDLPVHERQYGQRRAAVAGFPFTSQLRAIQCRLIAQFSSTRIASDHWVQFVFKVRLRSGSFKIQPSTLSSSKHWDGGVRMDPNFLDNQALEWVVPESEDEVVVGLMVRELGGAA